MILRVVIALALAMIAGCGADPGHESREVIADPGHESREVIRFHPRDPAR